ncbi:hypothetical protein [Tenacibaculum agarivorans]|uniref:hypothetical protein n=1 Tax=Tenacibaculum agarivorans TaxID=1908389 RepID=UPI000A6E072A|nr:hypothetical protein [Tenacibaculum agarivorans]
MKKFLLINTLIVLLFQSCKTDCSAVSCVSNNLILSFELLDANTDENLVENGSITVDNIKIINNQNNAALNFDFNTNTNILTINEDINNISNVDVSNIQIELDINSLSKNLFQLNISGEKSISDCCESFLTNDVKITGNDFTFDTDLGIYKIHIP